MSRLNGIFIGDGLGARIMRSAALTIFGFGASQALRLASNLILTRLLFPEAFGVMVLVGLIMMGLAMFSDIGIGPSIMQNKRGDDQDFLDTAWTIQVIRSVLLWVTASLLAWPMAQFYGVPDLVQLLPAAALSLLVMGFIPTRYETANRHLMLGRVTVLDLINQVIGLALAVGLAYAFRSVWALVISGVIGSTLQVILYMAFLPGVHNRFRWEKSAGAELIRFGRWIFLSTVAGFVLSQGDKAVLGKFLSLETLGIYNIGYFLASFPLLLGGMVVRRLLIPIYREKPPEKSVENFAALQKMRFTLSGLILLTLAIFAFSGVVLVQFMYDPRYHLAGAIVVVIAVMQLPNLVALTYDQSALAAGDSQRFFLLAATRAVLTIAGLLIGVFWAGLLGALIGQGIAMALAYPVVVWLAKKQGAWDPLHDFVVTIAGIALGFAAIWMNWAAVAQLFALKLP